MNCQTWLDGVRECVTAASWHAEPSFFDKWLEGVVILAIFCFALVVVVGVIALGVYFGNVLGSHHYCDRDRYLYGPPTGEAPRDEASS